MRSSTKGPRFLFFKQTSPMRSCFTELCLDVATPDHQSIVFSDIDSPDIGPVSFRRGPGYRRGTFRERLLTWISYLCQAVKFAFAVRGTPVIFMVSQPPFLPLLGYLQKKILGRPYVVWVDDVYPDAVERKFLLRHDSVVVRVWRWFNRLVFSQASAVFTLGPYMKRTVEQYVPKSLPVQVVPTWVDTEFIHPIHKDSNPFAAEHSQIGKTTILYSGNLGIGHDIDSILQAARRLIARTDLHFMIIGAGPRWHEVETSVKENADSNITLLPLQPEQVLPYSLATGDIALASMDKGMEGICMPSKTYYSLAAGSAVIGICPEESDLAYVLRSGGCGVVVEPGDVAALVAAIEDLTSNPQKLMHLRRNARNAAEQRFSRTNNSCVVRRVMLELAAAIETTK